MRPDSKKTDTQTLFSLPSDWPLTPLLRDDHQGLCRLAPTLPRLSRDAEDVDRLWLQASNGVLSSAGVEHVHRGRVTVGGVEVVGDLVGWQVEEGGRESSGRGHEEVDVEKE